MIVLEGKHVSPHWAECEREMKCNQTQRFWTPPKKLLKQKTYGGIPSRERVHIPTWGKGTSSTQKCRLGGDMLASATFMTDFCSPMFSKGGWFSTSWSQQNNQVVFRNKLRKTWTFRIFLGRNTFMNLKFTVIFPGIFKFFNQFWSLVSVVSSFELFSTLTSGFLVR